MNTPEKRWGRCRTLDKPPGGACAISTKQEAQNFDAKNDSVDLENHPSEVSL